MLSTGAPPWLEHREFIRSLHECISYFSCIPLPSLPCCSPIFIPRRLLKVVQAVSGRCEIYLDGGICRGTDVFKALALGAKAVFIGRPVLWGLAHSVSPAVASFFCIFVPTVSPPPRRACFSPLLLSRRRVCFLISKARGKGYNGQAFSTSALAEPFPRLATESSERTILSFVVLSSFVYPAILRARRASGRSSSS